MQKLIKTSIRLESDDSTQKCRYSFVLACDSLNSEDHKTVVKLMSQIQDVAEKYNKKGEK